MRIICAVGLIVTLPGAVSAQVPNGLARRTRSPETLERFENVILASLFTASSGSPRGSIANNDRAAR
jgi:hypothetical protein